MDETAAAAALGLTAGMIGSSNELVEIAPALRIERDPDARHGLALRAGDMERCGAGRCDASGQTIRGLAQIAIPLVAPVSRPQEANEFVAAPTGQCNGLIATGLAQAAGDFAQNEVTRLMAETVIDLLEMVEIEEKEDGVAALACDPCVEGDRQPSPIEKAGQLIAMGQFMKRSRTLGNPVFEIEVGAPHLFDQLGILPTEIDRLAKHVVGAAMSDGHHAHEDEA